MERVLLYIIAVVGLCAFVEVGFCRIEKLCHGDNNSSKLLARLWLVISTVIFTLVMILIIHCIVDIDVMLTLAKGFEFSSIISFLCKLNGRDHLVNYLLLRK